MVCELGPHRIASLEPHRSIDSVDRKEGEGIRTDKFPHALEVVGRGQQLVSFRRVNTVIIGVGNRRRGYAEVYFAGAGIAHHLHDLARGRAADDGIVNEHDTLAADDGAIGRVLHAHALIANRLCRLNEGTADIVIADNAKFVRYAGLLREAYRCRYAGVRHGDDHVSLGQCFTCQFRAHGFAHVVNVSATDDRIRP